MRRLQIHGNLRRLYYNLWRQRSIAIKPLKLTRIFLRWQDQGSEQVLKATLLLIFATVTLWIPAIAEQAKSQSSVEVASLCNTLPAEALLLGSPPVHLGQQLNTISFPVTPVSGPSERDFDGAIVTVYRSSGAFGNNPGLMIETTRCRGDDIIVGISKSTGQMTPRSIASWEVAAHNSLQQQTGQTPGRSIEGDRIVYRALKGSAAPSCDLCPSVILELSQSCRLSTSDRIRCAFTNSTFYFIISSRKSDQE